MILITKAISLQPITIEDHAKLFELMNRIYPPSYKHLWINEDTNWYIDLCYSKQNLEHELNENNAEYYFIYNKEYLTGILRFTYNTMSEYFISKSNTFLHRIYLGEESHGKGVAKIILDWVEVKSKHLNQDSIWLKAMDTQVQALQFYRKCSYKVTNKTQLDFKLIHKSFRGMVVLNKSLI